MEIQFVTDLMVLIRQQLTRSLETGTQVSHWLTRASKYSSFRQGSLSSSDFLSACPFSPMPFRGVEAWQKEGGDSPPGTAWNFPPLQRDPRHGLPLGLALPPFPFLLPVPNLL